MPANKRNFVVYDLETSGLDPKDGAEIVQIGAIALQYQDYELHQVGKFQTIIKPQTPEKAEAKALDVIGKLLWEKANSDGLHPKTALRKFREFMDSLNWQNGYWTTPIRVGFNNGGFDDRFLEYHMDKYKIINQKKDDKPWSYMSIDIAPILFTLFGRDNLKDNKLDTYAELMGVPRTTAVHDAMVDADITCHMFQRIMRLMGNHVRPMLKLANKPKEKVVA